MRHIRRLAAALMVLATFDIGWSAPAVSATSATSVTSAAAATRRRHPSPASIPSRMCRCQYPLLAEIGHSRIPTDGPRPSRWHEAHRRVGHL
jgi:hypothetical protein